MDNITSSVNIARKSGSKVLASIFRRSRRYSSRSLNVRIDNNDPIKINNETIEKVNEDEQASHLHASKSSENVYAYPQHAKNVTDEKTHNLCDVEISKLKTETPSVLGSVTRASGKFEHKYGKKDCRTSLRNQREYDSKKLFVQNIYEPLEDKMPKITNNIRQKIIQKKIVVTMDDPHRSRRSLLTTPICKSSSKNGTDTFDKIITDSDPKREYSVEWTIVENDSSMSSLSCGSTELLDISFSSSYGSNDSISDLLSDSDEDDIEETVDEADTHFAIFDFLRQKCREHSSNMSKISKKLKVLRGRGLNDGVEDLIQTERELLISSESYQNCVSNITNCNYYLDETVYEQIATITLSNILIPMKRRPKSHSENYYVCIARSEKTTLATQCIKPKKLNGKLCLVFEEMLVFEKLTENFHININIYELSFSAQRKLFKRARLNTPGSCYHYRSYLSKTKDNQKILHSAFQQCGGFQISLKNIQQNIIHNNFPSLSLSRHAEIKKMTSNLNITTTKRGYLNFGQRHTEDDIIIWNVKYVLLENSLLKIYNPSEDLDLKGEPLAQIDLKDVSSEMVTHTCHLKYCIQLNVICEEPEFQFRFHYSYFLRANALSDFESWFREIYYVLNTLQQWNMLEYIN